MTDYLNITDAQRKWYKDLTDEEIFLKDYWLSPVDERNEIVLFTLAENLAKQAKKDEELIFTLARNLVKRAKKDEELKR